MTSPLHSIVMGIIRAREVNPSLRVLIKFLWAEAVVQDTVIVRLTTKQVMGGGWLFLSLMKLLAMVSPF